MTPLPPTFPLILVIDSFLQSSSDMKEIISTNDATIQGILFGAVIALGAAVIYLYKSRENLQKDYIEELRKTNELVLKVNQSYNDYIQMIDRMTK